MIILGLRDVRAWSAPAQALLVMLRLAAIMHVPGMQRRSVCTPGCSRIGAAGVMRTSPATYGAGCMDVQVGLATTSAHAASR